MRPLAEPFPWIALAFDDEGLITGVAASVERWTGYSARELAGSPITQVLDDGSAFQATRIMQAARERGLWTGDLAHRTRNGKRLPARASVTLMRSGSDDRAGFVLVSAFCGLEKADWERCAQRLEIGARLREFAHELNNPLAVMMGFAQLALFSPECAGKIRSDISKLYDEMQRLVQVVEALHAYALGLQSHGEPEPQAASGGSARGSGRARSCRDGSTS